MAKPSNKSSDEKVQAVLMVLSGQRTASEVAKGAGVSEQTIHNWKRGFVDGGRAAFERDARSGSSREAQLEAENEELKAALGEAFLKLRMLERGRSPLSLGLADGAAVSRHEPAGV